MALMNITQKTALNGDKPFKFQIEGMDFLNQANGKACVMDECGLGKTVTSLIWLDQEPFDRLPAVAVVKSSLKTQWQRQFINWCSKDDGDGLALAQIIDNAKEEPLPGIPFYIISYDLLRRFSVPDGDHGIRKNKLAEMFRKRGVKTIILDEVQAIKNHQSQRAAEIEQICEGIPYVIGLSGTPIKNHPGEFYQLLHLLRPSVYPNFGTFARDDLRYWYPGKSTANLALRSPSEFQNKTKGYLIRRTREEVLPDLPKVMKEPLFVDLGDEVREAYINKYKEFQAEYNLSGGKFDKFENRGYILGIMSELRHITGWSKVDPCVDLCLDFLGSTDDRLCIFVHHHDVADLLFNKLSKYMHKLGLEPPLNLVGLSAELRERLKDQWIHSKSRILILSTLASGEGLDGLQSVCSNLVTLEREWNPANEEQVEGRFSRIGQNEQKIANKIFVAVGTIDEFFAKIVEVKRQSVGEALDGEAKEWTEAHILQELAEILAMQGGKPWGL